MYPITLNYKFYKYYCRCEKKAYQNLKGDIYRKTKEATVFKRIMLTLVLSLTLTAPAAAETTGVYSDLQQHTAIQGNAHRHTPKR